MEIPKHGDGLIDLLVIKTEDQTIKTPPPINTADFEPPITENIEKIETVETDEIQTEEPPKTRTLEVCKIDANFYIDLIDGVTILGFPALYKRNCFYSKTEFKQAVELKQKLDKNKDVELTETDLKLLEKLQDFRDYENSLGLNDDEKKLIADPLSKVLHKYQMTMPIEAALLIAVGTVYLPKILPLAVKNK